MRSLFRRSSLFPAAGILSSPFRFPASSLISSRYPASRLLFSTQPTPPPERKPSLFKRGNQYTNRLIESDPHFEFKGKVVVGFLGLCFAGAFYLGYLVTESVIASRVYTLKNLKVPHQDAKPILMLLEADAHDRVVKEGGLKVALDRDYNERKMEEICASLQAIRSSLQEISKDLTSLVIPDPTVAPTSTSTSEGGEEPKK